MSEHQSKVTSVAAYAVGALLWMVAAFLAAAISAFGKDGVGDTLTALLFPVLGLLFNVTGLIRPKRIQLDAKGLHYRPVWGRSRDVPWEAFAAWDVIVINAIGSGFVIYRQHGSKMGWRGLGFFIQPAALLRWISKTYSANSPAPDMKIFKGWVPEANPVG